jgi:hypothetical protein
MRSSYVRSMAFQSTSKFLPGSRWVLRSLLFIADKFGDLNLQEPESHEVAGSGTNHLSPAPIRVDLINEAQLGHELGSLWEMDPDPTGYKVDHTKGVHAAKTDLHHPLFQKP